VGGGRTEMMVGTAFSTAAACDLSADVNALRTLIPCLICLSTAGYCNAIFVLKRKDTAQQRHSNGDSGRKRWGAFSQRLLTN
jgi:hypothetical protein